MWESLLFKGPNGLLKVEERRWYIQCLWSQWNPTISPPCRYFPSNTTRLQYPITKTMKILKLKNKIKLNHLDGVSTFKRCFIRYWAPNKKFELDLCLIWEGMEEGYQTAYLPVQDLSHFKIGKLMIALMRMYNLLMHYV